MSPRGSQISSEFHNCGVDHPDADAMAQKWSTWGGAVGEIRCARCGACRTGSSPHTCDIIQEQTHKVETSPMAQHLLRRAYLLLP